MSLITDAAIGPMTPLFRIVDQLPRIRAEFAFLSMAPAEDAGSVTITVHNRAGEPLYTFGPYSSGPEAVRQAGSAGLFVHGDTIRWDGPPPNMEAVPAYAPDTQDTQILAVYRGMVDDWRQNHPARTETTSNNPRPYQAPEPTAELLARRCVYWYGGQDVPFLCTDRKEVAAEFRRYVLAMEDEEHLSFGSTRGNEKLYALCHHGRRAGEFWTKVRRLLGI